jgi:hypothetical protein
MISKEDRELLFKDLCARLPYYPKAEITFGRIKEIKTFESKYLFSPPYTSRKPKAYEVKLFLRPMSSMTEEEKKEVEDLNMNPFSGSVTDWLNARHFDYHDLIPKGLALEAPEGMYR